MAEVVVHDDPPPLRVVIACADREFDDLQRRLAKDLEHDAPVPLAVFDVPPLGGDPLPAPGRVAAADQADLLLVLLGRTCDPPPEGQSRSVARLQYDAALASPHATLVAAAIDTGLDPASEIEAWRSLILTRTPVAHYRFDDPELLVRLAEQVRVAAHGRAVALGLVAEPGGPGNQPPVPVPGEIASLLGPLDEAEPVGERLGPLGPRVPLDDTDPRTAPSGPAGPGAGAADEPVRAAAEEHWRQAALAWRTGRWSEFAHHLGRADDERPLNAQVALFRARVGLASGRIDRATKAIPLAERAAVLASEDDPPLAAAALLVAARAARSAGADPTDHLARARALAPDRAEPLVEQAIGLAQAGTSDGSAGVIAEAGTSDGLADIIAEAGTSDGLADIIAEAAHRDPHSMVALAGEPAIQGAGSALADGIAHAHARARAQIEPLHDLAFALDPASSVASRPAADLPYLELIRRGRLAALEVVDELGRKAQGLLGTLDAVFDADRVPLAADVVAQRPDPPLHRVGMVATIGLGSSLVVASLFSAGLIGYFGTWAAVAATERGLQERHERNAQVRSATARLTGDAAALGDHVERFEEILGAWPFMAPVVELDRAAGGDLVLVPIPAASPPELPLDSTLLPGEVTALTGVESRRGSVVLAQLVGDDNTRSLRRRAVYFDEAEFTAASQRRAPTRRRRRR